jgi:putative ABC transport system permease protein
LYKGFTTVLFIVAIVVGGISLVVAGIGVMNIMLVSVTERTREIGIRKAIGAKNKDIMRQFLIESLKVCAIGGLLGIGIGFGIAKFLAAQSFLSASISPGSIILGLIVTGSVGVFFGLFPARRASKLDPINALRYE